MFLPPNPRNFWLYLYIGINIISVGLIVGNGFLIGDPYGHAYESDALIILLALATVISYAFILGPLFGLLARIRVEPIVSSCELNSVSIYLGLVLFFLQAGFFAFNIFAGVNVAGAASSVSDSPFSLVWVFIPVDALFFIYYGYCRGHKLFIFNLVLWLVSNVMRGWSSVFLVVIFFEYCRLGRLGLITKKLVLLSFVAALVGYPVINGIKWAVRLAAGSGASVVDMVQSVNIQGGEVDYSDVVSDGVVHLVGRVHMVSMLSKVYENASVMALELNNGVFYPFWKEGIIGLAFDKISGRQKVVPVGVAMTSYAGLSTVENFGDWNVNISYLGWILFDYMDLHWYILYTLLLCSLSLFFLKKISGGNSGYDGVWFAWLLYLMPAWWGAFVGYVYAQFIFLVIVVVVLNIRGIFMKLRR